jgi:DNA helicase-2/ATP-dependent DNA helicase PcrA
MTLHAAKGLEFPVVYIMAVEQGILPHSRSLEQPEEIEEERRLLFVGMTRAMRELYLSRASFREFGGQQKYTIPSDFLGELPPEVEVVDLSGGGRAAAHHWRGGSFAARAAWADAGFTPAARPRPDAHGLAVGALVEHDDHGLGMIVEMSGLGRMRRIKVRFRTGEHVFVGESVRLSVVDGE